MIKVADRLNNVEEYYFSKKLDEIRVLRSQGRDVLNLGIGSPDLPPDEGVVQELVESASKIEHHAYQPYRSTPELRESMSRFYYETFSIKLDPQHEILPLLGSKEGVMYVSLAFLNPGDTVLVPNPGYPAYSSIAKLLGTNVETYGLTEENNWYPDFEDLESRDLEKVKLMWVNYPHMPTGAPATDELFHDLVAFAKRNEILLVNDNPYSQILNDQPVSILKFDPDLSHVIELNSLSKSFNMAGWRVGMVLGHKNYMDAVLQAKSNVDSGMFLPIQHAAAKALELKREWHDERNEIYETRRIKARRILESIGCKIGSNQVGMFIWAKVPDEIMNIHYLIDDLLHNALVFITPGEIFGSNGSRYLRISLCAVEELYDKALERIEIWQQEKLQLA
ncbi:MAG: aminotransferase class I/II-fold pyridoxal phosphate-dependent enzyme [Bacteroidota bacterium]